jgi:hypothetical protein
MAGVASEVVPTYCDKPWCYVDSDNCDRLHSPSRFSGLRYSFEACGHRNTFASEEAFIDVVRGKTLRVGVPGDNGNSLLRFMRIALVHNSVAPLWLSCAGYTIVRKPNGDLAGSFVTFMREISQEHGVYWDIKEISIAAREAMPGSSYSACTFCVLFSVTIVTYDSPSMIVLV